jgi:predicted MFS family arabinose efflux permease
MPIHRNTLGALEAVVVISQIGLTLLGMSCESFLGHAVPDEEKGTAAGWYQAGNFVGLGVGGGAALWLSQHLPAGWMVGAIVATVMLVCAFALLGMPEPTAHEPKESPHLVQAMRALGRDLWKLASSRRGLTGLIICLSPVGAGAVSNYFAALADGWHASAGTVELVTGVLGGVVSGVGCMAGGWLADRMSRRLSYGLAGAFTAATALAMALSPRAAWSYVVFSLVYQFFNGVAFAAFSGFVLETIGRGAVATKYNIFASLVNLAITYATRLDGAAHHRWGATGLLYTDAAITVAGIVVLLVMVVLVRPEPAEKPASASAG